MDAGNPVGPDGYVNFQDDGSTDADNMCTVMGSDGSWIQTPCDQTFAFVCQMPAGIVKVSNFCTSLYPSLCKRTFVNATWTCAT